MAANMSSKTASSTGHEFRLTDTEAYEPPLERFTPPREVVATPLAFRTPKVSKSSKRKSVSRAKHVTVKKELPNLDFSRAFTPPSPTEDPLLLSGRPSAKRKPLRSRTTPSFASSSPESVEAGDLHRSFASRLSGGNVYEFSTDESDMQLPVFDLPPVPSSDGWSESESDQDNFDQTGEYTGKFKMVSIPTKEDPPTSGTKDRMHSWGRPVSPFPYWRRLDNLLPEAVYEGEEMDGPLLSPIRSTVSSLQALSIATTTKPAVKVAAETLSVERAASPFVQTVPILRPPLDPPAPSLAHGHGFRHETALGDLSEVCSSNVDAADNEITPGGLAPPAAVDDDDEDEERVDRELSLEPNDMPEAALTPPMAGVSGLVVGPIEESDSSDEEEPLDSDVIKITSGDSRAAARAAAILRLHDYDCLLASSKRRRVVRNTLVASRKARRKTFGDEGIQKFSGSLASQRRATIHSDNMLVDDGCTAAFPALLLQVEDIIQDHSFVQQHTPKKSHPGLPTPLTASIPPTDAATGPRAEEWGRADWKRLDACFTEERLSMGAFLGLGDGALADVDDVLIENVVDRFVLMMGGEHVLRSLGSCWTRANLLTRVRTLQKKQWSGNPTFSTPTSSMRRLTPRLGSPPQKGTFCENSTCDNGLSEVSRIPRYHDLLQEAKDINPANDRQSAYGNVQSRMKGFFFSYLPILSRNVPRRAPLPAQPSRPPLPCPPPEIYQKSRMPIATPARPAPPRPIHPKELVQLHHASPLKKTLLPRVEEPCRLVQLKVTSTSPSSGAVQEPRPRRSSGGSVKDLVRCFEEMDDRGKRNEGNVCVDRRDTSKIRPTWRP
ncbi:hypothetical protein BV22DRAFT_1195737 [Leucogyrophana mollusca]|uniref:Uncharacterized protein n=1 Tax=Leucogyrophana mollusca TaxID=85980 RepID=A0ACB8BHM7_9AGAM|nr:hypothetical protein BV22DRAFT_1195737 [Leucogyrophana mollusca]